MSGLMLLAALGSSPGQFASEIQAACEDARHVWPVPVELVRAVIRQESNFEPRAISKAGAIGLMQLMPQNAAKLGFSEEQLWNPAKNILAGVRLLAAYLKHYDGDVISALVAYNAHPMELGAPVPQNRETPEYVRRVLHFYRMYQAEHVERWKSRVEPTAGSQTTAPSTPSSQLSTGARHAAKGRAL